MHEFKIGDKVKTTDEWNELDQPVEGVIISIEYLKYSKCGSREDKNGHIIQWDIGKYEYIPQIKLDNGFTTHPSWFILQ